MKLFGVYAGRVSVGIDVTNCSATREDKRRAGQEKTNRRTRPEPGHRVQGRGQSGCPGLVSEDKRRKTAGPEKENRRTRPSHRVRGAAKTRTGQGQEEDKTRTQSRATEPGHRAQPQTSGARPVSVASFFSKIDPQQ